MRDHAGQLLANRLDGSGGDLRNIFPPNPHFELKLQSRGRSGVRLTINSLYENAETTRLYGIVYRAVTRDTAGEITINKSLNPDPDSINGK